MISNCSRSNLANLKQLDVKILLNKKAFTICKGF